MEDINQELRKKLKPYMEEIRENILFRGFSEEEIFAVIELLSPHIMAVRKKETVAYDGDRLPEMGVVLSGRLRLSHIDQNGNCNLMELVGPGECFGSIQATGGYRLSLSIVAEEPSQLLRLSLDKLFKSSIMESPLLVRFLQNLALRLAEKARSLTKKLDDSVRRSTRERLSDYLSGEYYKNRSKVFTIPLNRQDLADFLFVDRSAMSSELGKMRDEGLIRFDKSRFELLVEMPDPGEEED